MWQGHAGESWHHIQGLEAGVLLGLVHTLVVMGVAYDKALYPQDSWLKSQSGGLQLLRVDPI